MTVYNSSTVVSVVLTTNSIIEDHATSPEHRHRLLQIDKEGGVLTRIIPPGYPKVAADTIVVEASVDGLGSSSVSIPVSTDVDSDSVLPAVARKWMSNK